MMAPERSQPSSPSSDRDSRSRRGGERVHSRETVRAVADRVYKLLLRELRLEAERRGPR